MKITSILTQSIGGAGIAGSRLINSYIELIDGVYTRDISNINAKNKLISHNKFSYFDRFNQRLLQPKVLVPKKGVIKSTFQTRYYFGKINSDVINLHWVANYLDWHTFFRDNSNKKNSMDST